MTDLEGKLAIYVLATQGSDVEAAIANAWALADPGFNLEAIAINVAEPPLTGDLEKEVVITYNSGDESTFIQVGAQLCGGIVYTRLVRLDLIALQKRASQVGRILTGFTIIALEQVDQSDGSSPPLTDDIVTEYEEYVVDSMKRLTLVTEWLVQSHVLIKDALMRHFLMFLFSDKVNAIFGDSHFARGIWGIDGFVNLAWPNDHIRIREIKVTNYFKERKPGKIILQTSPHMFSPSTEERGLENYPDVFGRRRLPRVWMFSSQHKPNLYSYWRQYVTDEAFRSRVTFQHDGALTRTTVFAELVATDNPITYTKEGPKAARLERANYNLSFHTPMPDIPSTRNAEALRRTLAYLDSGGATVCMVTSPVSAEYLELSSQVPGFGEAKEFFGSLAAQHGFRYMDMSDAITDQRMFADAHHLNDVGAKVFSQLVADVCFG